MESLKRPFNGDVESDQGVIAKKRAVSSNSDLPSAQVHVNGSVKKFDCDEPEEENDLEVQ